MGVIHDARLDPSRPTAFVAAGGAQARAVVRVVGLRKVFKGDMVANDNIDLEILPGEVFGLLGPNGAGKTTLIMQVMGLLKPTAGAISVLGHDVVAHPNAAKGLVGFMPQKQIGHREMKVDQALYITGRLRGMSAAAARAQTEEVIARLDIGEFRRRPVEKLSGGMNRLATFAVTLMGRPQLIVLDEPTNDLDPLRRRRVWDVVAELNREGATVLLVTHNVLEAERVIQRVAIMSAGRIKALGSPGQLKARLGDEIRMEFVMRHTDGAADATVRRAVAPVEPLRVRPGRYVALVPRAEGGRYVDRALAALGEDVEDFRIAPPTLEDVYIQLDGHPLDDDA